MVLQAAKRDVVRCLFILALYAMQIAPLAAASCEAKNADALQRCVELAGGQGVDRIEVTGRISCGRYNPCRFVLREIARPLVIIGTSPDAGFYRELDAGPAFGVRILDSKGPIVVRNLTFDEGPNSAMGAPGQVWTNATCPRAADCPEASLEIGRSENILVDHCRFLSAKNMALEIGGSSNITVRRSHFSHSWIHGIWLARHPASRGVHVENNVFEDIRSNAIMFSGRRPSDDEAINMNTITGNVFRHNHSAAVYHSCGVSHWDPCPGGQLDIEQQSESLMVADNIFIDGKLDEDKTLENEYLVSGVEVAPVFISGIVIFHNYFSKLTGSAVAIDSADAARDTQLVDNVFPVSPVPQVAHASALKLDTGNCAGDTNSCRFAVPTGNLELGQASSKVTSTGCVAIEWRASNFRAPLIMIADGLRRIEVKNQERGQLAPVCWDAWVRGIDLYSAYTLVASLDRPEQ